MSALTTAVLSHGLILLSSGGVVLPEQGDVRQGVDRGDGELGTLIVPDADYVMLGIAVDHGEGTLVIPDPEDVRNGLEYGPGGASVMGAMVALVNPQEGDSIFTRAMNVANAFFGGVAGEQFDVVGNGLLGTYWAISIDDLSMATAVAPGGRVSDVSVNIFIHREVLAQAQIKEGTILSVRGKRVRVKPIADDGDNTLMLQCSTVAMKLGS